MDNLLYRLKKIFNNNLISSFSIYFTGKALIAISGFLLVPIYSRVLEPQEFGVIALIMIFFQISKTIIKLGLEASFSIKFYKNKYLERINSLYSIYIVYILIIFFVIVFTLVDFTWINKILDIDLSLIESLKLIGMITFAVFTEFFFNLLKMEQHAKLYAINTVSFAISRVVLLIYFIVVLKQGYVSYLNANLLSYIIFFIISLFYILKKYKLKMFSFDKNIIRNLIRIGLPIVPGGIFAMILSSGDQYILKRFGLLSAVGIYAMGYKFANAFSSFLIVPFRQALIPIAMKKGNNDISNYKSFLKKVLENFIAILLFCMLTVYSFFYQVYVLIIDQKYHEGFNIIWIVILSSIIWGVANILSNTIVLREQTHKTLLLTAIATILNIGLNIFWIPKYTIYGAAYATLISYSVVTILYYILSQKIIEIDYNFKKIAISVGLFILIFRLENFIDKLNYNSFALIFIKLIMIVLTGYIYLRYKIIDLSISRRPMSS